MRGVTATIMGITIMAGADVTIMARKNIMAQQDYNAEVGRGNYNRPLSQRRSALAVLSPGPAE